MPVYVVAVLVAPFYMRFAQTRKYTRIAVLSLLILLRWKVPEPLLIIASAVAGLLLYSH